MAAPLQVSATRRLASDNAVIDMKFVQGHVAPFQERSIEFAVH
jgi:hypothetical protein